MISVVIPVFNGEHTIRETIQSVLDQTFTDTEIIIVNDGSQDSTLEIVDQIKDSRVKVFSYPNKGLAASRNRGLAKATGEYISFIDADDLWTTDKLESQYRALQENPQAAVAYSWTNYVDQQSQFLRSGLQVVANGNVYAKMLTKNFIENGSNVLIITQPLKNLGGFDESLPCVEDWDMYLRLAAHYDFVCVPVPQILYRVSTQSMSTNISKMENAGLKVINKAFSHAPKDLQSLQNRSLANFYLYLTLKSLEGVGQPKKSLSALKLLGKTIKHQPSIIRQRQKLILISLIKVFSSALLPARQYQTFLDLIKKFNR